MDYILWKLGLITRKEPPLHIHKGTQEIKTWEECRLDNELVIYTNNTYSINLILSHYIWNLPIIDHNQHYIADTLVVRNFNAPLCIQPTISRTTQQDPIIAIYDNAIWNLTKQLSIKVTNNKPKGPQSTEERHNVWCHNRKGQGFLANECPIPNALRTKCILCGGNHVVQACWNLKPHKRLLIKMIPINLVLGNKNEMDQGRMPTITQKRILIVNMYL